MPEKDELKAKVCQAIDRRSDEIVSIAKNVGDNPESGFKEAKTARLVARKFGELGITYRDGLAITGVKGIVQGGSDGPTIGVIGELDSLIIPDHPKANYETGAAHACGHDAQIGMLIGVAVALTSSGILPFLAGRVALMAVPAEEYIEIEFREKLRGDGKLSYIGGKPELIKLGEFDDIDIAMMSHVSSDPEVKKLALGGTNVGMVAKKIQFIGRGAHAGAVPHQGINALNAAMVALAAIHVQRETFKDDDTVRIHPIITKGGETVNIVPADVRMETFVRGKTMDAIKDANEKVDRALRAGASAVGGKVRIATFPGYLPIIRDPYLQDIYRWNAVSIVGEDGLGEVKHSTASTDMGDVSHIMPVIHPMAGGATGIAHGSDYLIQDYELAVLNPAKSMAMTVVDLLYDGGIQAREVLSKSMPRMTKQQYLGLIEGLIKEEEYEG